MVVTRTENGGENGEAELGGKSFRQRMKMRVSLALRGI